MAIRVVVSCDICGIDRKETNNWWTIWTDRSGYNANHLSLTSPNKPGDKHICGIGCSSKMYMRWMETGKLNTDKSLYMLASERLITEPSILVKGPDFDDVPDMPEAAVA